MILIFKFFDDVTKYLMISFRKFGSKPYKISATKAVNPAKYYFFDFCSELDRTEMWSGIT